MSEETTTLDELAVEHGVNVKLVKMYYKHLDYSIQEHKGKYGMWPANYKNIPKDAAIEIDKYFQILNRFFLIEDIKRHFGIVSTSVTSTAMH